MKKKGMTAKVLASIIIVLAIFIILLSATPLFEKIFREVGTIEQCRLSVLAAAKSATKDPLFSLDCPREQVEIVEKDVKDGNKISEEKIKRAIADQIKLCWYKMGKGQLEAFDRNWIAGRNSACLICSEISFDEDIQKEFLRINKMYDYLNETTFGNSDITYMDYLTVEREGIERVAPFWFKEIGSYLGIDDIGVIQTEKRYYITYMGYVKEFTNKLPALTTSGFQRFSNGEGHIFILEAKDFDSLECEYLYN